MGGQWYRIRSEEEAGARLTVANCGFRFYSKCSARPPKSLDRRATNLIKVRKVFW